MAKLMDMQAIHDGSGCSDMTMITSRKRPLQRCECGENCGREREEHKDRIALKISIPAVSTQHSAPEPYRLPQTLREQKRIH